MGIDVKNVRLATAYKLSEDVVTPIYWTVPRKRKEFFQDDLFIDT